MTGEFRGPGNLNRQKMVILAAMSAAATACSDPLSPSALAGLYDITVYEATSIDDPALRQDLIEQGVVMQFGIAEDGGFTLVINGLAAGGTMRVGGNAVTLTFTEGRPSALTVWSGTIRRDGDTVALSLDEGIEWGFPERRDEVLVVTIPVPARLRIVMVRNDEKPN